MDEINTYLDKIRNKYTTFDQFRQHVESTLTTRDQRKGDYSWLDEGSPEAGILFGLLVPISVIEEGIETKQLITDHVYLLLEKRSEDMDNHPGDVAFPGGTKEEQDQDIIETAYREAEEELGLRKEKPEFIAFMDEFISSSSILVHPVVSWVKLDIDDGKFIIRSQEKFSPKTSESVATVILPLTHFLNPENYSSKKYFNEGKHVGWVRYFDIDMYLSGDHIWGLTASMIRRFINIVFPENILKQEPLEKSETE